MYQFRSRPTTEWSVIYWICFVTDRPSRGRAAWFTNGFHLWDNNVHLHFLVGFFRFYYYYNFFSPRRLDFGVKIIQHTYLSIIHYSTSVTGPVDLSRGVRATVVATRVYAWNYPNIVLRPSVRTYVRSCYNAVAVVLCCCVCENSKQRLALRLCLRHSTSSSISATATTDAGPRGGTRFFGRHSPEIPGSREINNVISDRRKRLFC